MEQNQVPIVYTYMYMLDVVLHVSLFALDVRMPRVTDINDLILHVAPVS